MNFPTVSKTWFFLILKMIYQIYMTMHESSWIISHELITLVYCIALTYWDAVNLKNQVVDDNIHVVAMLKVCWLSIWLKIP